MRSLFVTFLKLQVTSIKAFLPIKQLKLFNMKFCPQCGTLFEQKARFCLECGFDRSTIEDAEPINPEATGTEKVNSEEIPVRETEPQTEAKPRCPQCGQVIDITDRFCPECGFGTSVSNLSEKEVPHAILQPEDKEMITPIFPVEQPESLPLNNQFCPQCGSGISSEDRFCPQCGFDTLTARSSDFTKSEPILVPPVFVPPPAPKPSIIPPTPEVTPKQTPVYPPVQQPTSGSKGKKTKLWLILALLIFGILGAAGWFLYSSYISSTEDTTEDTVITMGIPENAESETGNGDVTDTDVSGESDAADKPASDAKPLSRVDQEIAKQRAKEQSRSIQTNKPNQSAEVSATTSANEIVSKIILEVGHKEEPKNTNPKNPSKLTIRKATMITRITTDHYNDGMGTPRGGIITIKDSNGNVKGRFKALGKTGKNGTPSAKWVAEPNIMLEKGTYLIGDSDMASWSKTFLGNNGFIVVEGYEIE